MSDNPLLLQVLERVERKIDNMDLRIGNIEQVQARSEGERNAWKRMVAVVSAGVSIAVTAAANYLMNRHS
jgi:hypothetical protein